VHWRTLPPPLTALPRWQSVEPDKTWAPEVAKIGARFVMYYVGRSLEAGRQCISVATADQAEGPFQDSSAAPLVCQAELGGSIDPSRFVDADGTPYLLWKNDGNCCGQPTDFWGQRLTEDGLSLSGQPQRLGIRNDQAWEGSVVEAPVVLLHGGRYYLFYSANAYDQAAYAVGYGVADQVLGPYTKPAGRPILSSRGSAGGPGGQSVVVGPRGGLWFVYHAWAADRVGYSHAGVRSMWLDRLTFDGARPIVEGEEEVESGAGAHFENGQGPFQLSPNELEGGQQVGAAYHLIRLSDPAREQPSDPSSLSRQNARKEAGESGASRPSLSAR
jgi:beta-xylosidase